MQKHLSVLSGLLLIHVLLFCFFVCQSTVHAEFLAKITVDARDCVRIETPVAVSLGGIPIGFKGDNYRLLEGKGTELV